LGPAGKNKTVGLVVKQTTREEGKKIHVLNHGTGEGRQTGGGSDSEGSEPFLGSFKGTTESWEEGTAILVSTNPVDNSARGTTGRKTGNRVAVESLEGIRRGQKVSQKKLRRTTGRISPQVKFQSGGGSHVGEGAATEKSVKVEPLVKAKDTGKGVERTRPAVA